MVVERSGDNQRKGNEFMTPEHETLVRAKDKSVSDYALLVEYETDLISRLEKTQIEPTYIESKNHPNRFPSGDYARHLTEIQDAYWRRGKWRDRIEDLTGED